MSENIAIDATATTIGTNKYINAPSSIAPNSIHAVAKKTEPNPDNAINSIALNLDNPFISSFNHITFKFRHFPF